LTDSAATECLLFPEIFAKPIRMEFDQRQGSSDGGAMLLKAAERRFGLISSMVDCLFDGRQAAKVDHPHRDLFTQRVSSIACSYPDANDSARLPVRKDHRIAPCSKITLQQRFQRSHIAQNAFRHVFTNHAG